MMINLYDLVLKDHTSFHLYDEIIKKDSRQIINIETPELDTVFKPGFYNQAKEIINYLKDHDHNLVNLEEYEKTVKIIRGIYAT